MNLRHITKFAMVGSVNTAIDVSLFALFVNFLHWSVVPANVISYSAGILNSFLMNKFWTFRDRTPLTSSARPFLRFCAFNLSGLLLSTTIVALGSLVVPTLAAKLLSVFGVFGWNYLSTKLWVFRRGAE